MSTTPQTFSVLHQGLGIFFSANGDNHMSTHTEQCIVKSRLGEYFRAALVEATPPPLVVPAAVAEMQGASKHTLSNMFVCLFTIIFTPVFILFSAPVKIHGAELSVAIQTAAHEYSETVLTLN